MTMSHRYRCVSCGESFGSESFARRCPSCGGKVLVHESGERRPSKPSCSGTNCAGCTGCGG